MDRNRIIAKEYDWDALSLSARRAWIEINKRRILPKKCIVALRKESVDRNVFAVVIILPSGVALRKESVDRNFASSVSIPSNPVALRKESVDRNIELPLKHNTAYSRSPQGERG